MTAIPLADAPRLRRVAVRTRWARLAVAAALLAAVVIAVLAGRSPSVTSHPYLPAGSTGLVVLDLSASISTSTFQQIDDTLAQIAASGGRYGLVVFSATAYELFPPETPAREFKNLERVFHVQPGTNGFGTSFPTTPWTLAFSAGTAISTGLDLALDLAQRNHLHRPSLLLISDLNDNPGDLRRVAATALELRRAHIHVRVVALGAAPADARLFARLLGGDGLVKQAPPPGTRPPQAHAAFPTALVVAAALVAALLAAAELAFAPLRFRTETAQ